MKNGIKIKAIYRIAGIIAVVAVIILSMEACDLDDPLNLGDLRRDVKIIFSLDKIDDRSFTLTAQGEKWGPSGLFVARDQFTSSLAAILVDMSGERPISNLSVSQDNFKFEKTSDYVITFTLLEHLYDLTGTITGKEEGYNLMAAFDLAGSDKVTSSFNPNKKSITF